MKPITSRIVAAAFAATLTATLVGCSPSGDTDDHIAPDAPPPPATSQAPEGETPSDSNAPGTEGEVTLERAGQIATDAYGGTIRGIEDDDYLGEPAWEVELADSSQGRIEVKVSKATGEILDVEQD